MEPPPNNFSNSAKRKTIVRLGPYELQNVGFSEMDQDKM